MKVVFSSIFKQDLLEAETRYASISPRLGEDFHERVKATIRTIIRWRGGDHIGPHGFPCRRCRPFPHLVYYALEGGTLHILGLVHERRHPDYLRQRLEAEG
ncbi:MAG: hypothetical protein HZA93_12350 [Verrucomicrobia bacterium]|nr:hypothetical protein [Verrucomicrobiota bacterium]